MLQIVWLLSGLAVLTEVLMRLLSGLRDQPCQAAWGAQLFLWCQLGDKMADMQLGHPGRMR